MQEGRGCGGKRVCRTNISLTNEMDSKLIRLAVSCGMPKTTLAALIVEMCLRDPLAVSKLQKEYNIHPAYKILPINKGGKTKYMMKE